MKSLHSPLLLNSLVQRIVTGSFSRSGTPISALKMMELIRTNANIHIHTYTHTQRPSALSEFTVCSDVQQNFVC